ncbi:hypothetical protein [Schumannella soli]|uniref:Uncharacterized protein n=1 Tax=Schumannella soli TaxID=2590779 RepID=A0A506Y0T7_9MICO|nr:hypothetical protein [Schumannella soli]TPW76146.1 hypothetical protein FJ657_10060 [Schumannella soli]
MNDPGRMAKRVIITQCLSLAIAIAVLIWGAASDKAPLMILGFVLVVAASGMLGVGVWLLRRSRPASRG